MEHFLYPPNEQMIDQKKGNNKMLYLTNQGQYSKIDFDLSFLVIKVRNWYFWIDQNSKILGVDFSYHYTTKKSHKPAPPPTLAIGQAV